MLDIGYSWLSSVKCYPCAMLIHCFLSVINLLMLTEILCWSWWQAITALKKGACLLKYGRRGKPKFCPFRLSNDESVLIWFSGKEEKHLKLSHVSRIISGQRTPIFQRYPRPEKEYQSFSLIYNDRSLDLVRISLFLPPLGFYLRLAYCFARTYVIDIVNSFNAVCW